MATPITVFSTDFDGSLPIEIDPGSASLTGVEGYAGYGPAGNQFGGTFLRSAGGNVVTLQLTGLPPHTALNLSFLFAAIDSLDGTGDFPAGDFFNVKVDGVSIFNESFANALEEQVQSYVPAPGVQLARRVDLGFTGPGGFYTDSAYDLGSDPAFHNIPHTASSVTITFEIEGPGVQDISDESWAIDNLTVSVVPPGTTPAPTTIALTNDTGSSATDLVTRDASFSGITDPFAEVTLKEGATTLGTVTADATGAWTLATPSLADGVHTITANSASLTFTLDTTAPAAPTLTLASFSGAATDEWFFTSSGLVNVSGLEAGASWEYSPDGGQHWVGGSGANFTVAGDGRYHILARQTDLAGNLSDARSLDFTLDTIRAVAVGQSATGNPYIDGLLIATKWSGGITFSFPQSRMDYPRTYGTVTPEHPYGVEVDQVVPVTFQEQEAVRAMLLGQTASASTPNVMRATSLASFIATGIFEAGGLGNGLNGTGDIRIAEGTWLAASPPGANFPGNEADGAGGDVWMNAGSRNAVLGSLAYSAWQMHELGHALGLSHAHEGGFAATVPADRDAMEFTVMSYRDYVGDQVDGAGSVDFPQTFMMYDILALQTMYGADYGLASNNTDTVYSWSPTTGQTFINGVSRGTPVANIVFLTIWDGGGNDTYDLSNYTNGVFINLNPGSWSITSQDQLARLEDGQRANGTVYNSLLFNGDARSLIENAIGGPGNDTIFGNQAANLLVGNGGNDRIDGQDGADNIDGGAGNDILRGAGGADSVNGGAGNDNVNGGSGADTLYGGFGIDTLVGEAGDDILLPGAGIDVVNGGTGSDTVSFANAGAAVSVDLLWSFAIGSGTNFDVLSSIENVAGSPFDDQLYGSNGANVLMGSGGGDALYGRNGNDRLDGGTGNDALNGMSGNDTFVFAPGFGNDTIRDFDFNPSGGQDLMDISAFGITAATFDAHVSFADLGANILITIDADGNQTITLAGAQVVSNFTLSDFILV